VMLDLLSWLSAQQTAQSANSSKCPSKRHVHFFMYCIFYFRFVVCFTMPRRVLVYAGEMLNIKTCVLIACSEDCAFSYSGLY